MAGSKGSSPLPKKLDLLEKAETARRAAKSLEKIGDAARICEAEDEQFGVLRARCPHGILWVVIAFKDEEEDVLEVQAADVALGGHCEEGDCESVMRGRNPAVICVGRLAKQFEDMRAARREEYRRGRQYKA